MNLESPAWLLLWIAVPILAVCAVLSGRFMKAPWEAFAAERLRGRLIKRDHPLPRWMSLGMTLAAIVAMAFTLARPQGDAGTKTETTTGRNVMIALDLSRSMRVTICWRISRGRGSSVQLESIAVRNNREADVGSVRILAKASKSLAAWSDTASMS